MPVDREKRGTCAVVGGGLAGLSAALELATAGRRVDVFEQRRALGGRAASRVEPATGATIDLCQHLAMGCCTEWLAFCARLGLANHLCRSTGFQFIDPRGRRHDVAPSTRLPPPWHLLPALARLRFLSLRERVGVARAVARLARNLLGNLPNDPPNESRDGPPGEASSETIGHWLARQGQTPRAIEFFWKPILLSALGETLDRASLTLARKVFVEGMLASVEAGALWIPTIPLEWLFDRLAGKALEKLGVRLHRGVKVVAIEGDRCAARRLTLADGRPLEFDAFVVAVPWFQAARLLAGELRAAVGDSPGWSRLPGVPITAVHLWYDRPPTELAHAVLLGRIGQWWFQPPWAGGASAAGRVGGGDQPDGAPIPHKPPRDDTRSTIASTEAAGYYGQVVVSASRALLELPTAEVARLIVDELAEVWPGASTARLLRASVVTHRRAVFSTAPRCDALRPPQRTAVSNLVLAGDWTATGWPATMEGAVRAGRLAATVLLDTSR